MAYHGAMRILLADDHNIVRKGIKGIIDAEPDLEVVAEESSGLAALEAIRALRPEVAVLDIEMPGLTGLEVARRVVQDGLGTAVVVLSVHSGNQFVTAAIDAGVRGYVLKEDAPADLLAAIRAAERGELYLSQRLVGPALMATRAETGAVRLAPRERDIVRLLAEGKSSKAIAEELSLAPKTVDAYRQNVMAKLGLRSVAAVVKYALKHQLARIDD